MIKAEFELPVGYEAPDGVICKKVTMRRIKNKDLLDFQKDPRIKELANDKSIDLEGNHPVVAMRSMAALYEMFAVLFARVVIGIEGVKDINTEIFKEFYAEDMDFLIEKYNELNGNTQKMQEMINRKVPLPSGK